MRARTTRIACLALIALVSICASSARALASFGEPPALPSRFHGTVTFNGANVPAGTEITAGHGGMIYARTTTIVYEGASYYSLDVPGDDPETPEREGGTAGEILEFTIGGLVAIHPLATWRSGTNETLDLAAGKVPPTVIAPTVIAPTPTPTPTRLMLYLPLLLKR